MDETMLEPLVASVLRDQFPGVAISRIIIEPEMDSDGAAILRITIVLKDVNQLISQDALVGVVRHLRSRLAEAGHEEFPVLSFVSERDAKKLIRESA